MTTTQIPNLSVQDLDLTEVATVGAVLISGIETARRIQAGYVTNDLTEPRLQVIDRIARYLVSENVAPSIAAVTAAATHLGEVRAGDIPALSVLLFDLVDVNITPQIHVGETMARQLVRASVRRRIAVAGERLSRTAETADTPTLMQVANSEAHAVLQAIGRLIGGDQS